MVTINMSNQIEFKTEDISARVWRLIKADLTLSNPDFKQALKFGHNTNGKPEHIELFRFEGDRTILPRGYGRRLVEVLQSNYVKFKFVDNRLELPSVEFNSSIQLRDYQETAVREMVISKIGGIVAPCGAGKTMIMLETMARIGQPSLWVTHTKELAQQVMERACQVFDITPAEIGMIGDGKFSIGDRLTVALIQTLSKANIEEFKDCFGAVFIDEAHHLAARSFFYPVGQFPAKYRLWVSATPDRADGLTDMVLAAGGNILHTIKQSEVPTIIPRLETIETDFYCSSELNYTDIMSKLIRNDDRNTLIVETIAANTEGHYSLVLSDRTEHLDVLLQMLQDRMHDKKIEILKGTMGKKERESVMLRVKDKQVDILLATQLAREGLDIVHLDRLFLATPKKAAAAVQQEVGRIMRPATGKSDGVVYDFWDSKTGILQAQFWKRRAVYKQIGMDLQTRHKQQAK